MGGVVSDARSNSSLVEALIESGHLSNDSEIKDVLQMVDRGRFLSALINQAYENRSWQWNKDFENFYLDPSFIYVDVLNELKLRSADSILHIGSGIGFFGIVASFLIGYQGKYIGIEHNRKAVHFAATRHQNFVTHGPTFDMKECCEPIYLIGDITKFKPGFAKFDKIFCNATITIDLLPLLSSFLKIGGILVVTIDEYLISCKRLDEQRIFLKKMLCVQMPLLMVDEGSIIDLYPKSPTSKELFKDSSDGMTIVLRYSCIDYLPNLFFDSIEQRMWTEFEDQFELKPNSLKKLCRGKIRQHLRQRLEYDKPTLKSDYFNKNLIKNCTYEMQRIKISLYASTSCCLKRDNYSQINITSKLNCKFKDYRKAIQIGGLDNLIANPKNGLCPNCKKIDSMTLIEFGDYEDLKNDIKNCVSFRYFLENRINQLPLPTNNLVYINYNRSFDKNDENF